VLEPEDMPAKRGPWVPAFANNVEPGDTIRWNGQERYVVGRDRTPATQPTFRIEYGTEGETIAKTATVEILDPDGSVTRRVARIYDPMVLGDGNSGSQGVLGGFVEPK
jgi:hypothetical protein